MNLFRWISICSIIFLLAGCGSDDDKKEPRTVLVMGDSLSTGGHIADAPPWPSLLASDRPTWTVVNSSRNGEKMGSGSARLSGQLAAHSPDQVVIFYGANNAIQGDVGSFEGSLRGAIQTAMGFGVDRVVVCTVPLFYGSRSIFNGRVEDVNNIIRTAAKQEGAAVADLNREFGGNSGDLFPDGLHPNLDAARIIMISVKEKL